MISKRRTSRRGFALRLAWLGFAGIWWPFILLILYPQVGLQTELTLVMSIQIAFIGCILYGIFILLNESIYEREEAESPLGLPPSKHTAETDTSTATVWPLEHPGAVTARTHRLVMAALLIWFLCLVMVAIGVYAILPQFFGTLMFLIMPAYILALLLIIMVYILENRRFST